MLTVTFVRHGESTDNLRPVWAGWTDSPLSNHGMNQARALGESWHTTLRTPIHRIYASDLKRAHTTAQQLVAPRRALAPTDALACPPIHTTPLVREQHFGIAEGKRWSAGPIVKAARRASASAPTSASASSPISASASTSASVSVATEPEVEVYETIRTRHDKFPGGESLDDLALRADEAIDTLVWPHLDDAMAHAASTSAGAGADAGTVNGDGGGREEAEGGLGYHVVVVSHGLCISEMIAALLRRSANAGASAGVRLRGLVNTGWTRLHIRPLENGTLDIMVVAINQAPHLVSVKRQSGGIGSAPGDEKQRSIREFFGGASATPEPRPNDTSS